MKKWKIYTIAITTAFTLTGGAVYAGISYLEGILDPTTVAAAEPTPVPTPTVLPNSYTLNNFKFDYRRFNSINGQTVLYNGEETSVALLPQEDRTKAINSALSTSKEAAKALRYVHGTFDEILGGYNAGIYKTEGYGHSVEAAEQAKDGTFDVRLTNLPELYLRLADVVGNEKAAKGLRDVAALVEIGMKNRDVQALLYAHRIIHNVDSFVINAPDDGEEYSAAKIAESTAYIENHRTNK